MTKFWMTIRADDPKDGRILWHTGLDRWEDYSEEKRGVVISEILALIKKEYEK